MGVKVEINGFGRIGRLVYRAAMGNSNLDIVADGPVGAGAAREEKTHVTTRINNSGHSNSVSVSSNSCNNTVIDGNTSVGVGGGGDGTSKSNASEDEGGGDEEEDKQGLKRLLKSLPNKVLDIIFHMVSIIGATIVLHWMGLV